LLLLLTPLAAFPDGGVLIPRDKAQPNPAILSLEEMEITVQIDNGDARVFVRQVFVNHTERIEEGNYVFALPSYATVSDFAVWDGPVRIPAVILERKRAGEIYNELKQQSIDPGLLQMGERGAEEAKRSAIFSARIVPIPAFGTKRLEFEYHEAIPVENLKSYFAIPLRPDAYQAQVAHHFKISFELRSAHALTNFQAPAKAYPLQVAENSPHVVRGTFEGENVNLTEDFVTTFDLDKAGSDTLAVITHRNPLSGQPSPTEMAPVRSTNEPGFFATEALLGLGPSGAVQGNAAASAGVPKTVVILFDTSLSMQWEKLERSYQALETLVRSLKPEDKFNLILFNSQVQTFQAGPVTADSNAVQRALDFVRHFAFDAVGETGAELPGAGNAAAFAETRGQVQPDPVQQSGADVSADAGARGQQRRAACARFCAHQPFARRNESPESDAGGFAGIRRFRRQSVPGAPERRRSHRGCGAQREDGRMVRSGVEASARSEPAEDLHIRSWG